MGTQQPGQAAYRPDIDGLRAIAVSAVVIYHFFPAALPGGFKGVDVFFVISGYLITGIIRRELAEGRFSLWRFYERRVRRILPALFTVVVCTLAAGAAVFMADDFEALARSAIASTLFVANIHFFSEINYFWGREGVAVLHLWSLGVEEQFYVVVPLLLMALAAIRPQLITPAILIGVIVSLVACILVSETSQRAAFYLMPFRAWELGIGALLTSATVARLAAGRASVLGVAGLALLLPTLALGEDPHTFPSYYPIFACLGTALLIAAGSAAPINRALGVAPMRMLGLVSYSFYLWHWPVFIFADYLRPGGLPFHVSAGGIVLSLVLAIATYRFIETPLRHPRREGAGFRGPLPAAGAAMLALTVGAGGIVAADGFPGRWDQAALAASAPTVHPSLLGENCVWLDGVGGNPDLACGIGAHSGPVETIVWGDSHANALQPGFRRLSAIDGRHRQLLVKFGCPPLAGVESRMSVARGSCQTYQEGALDYIARVRPRRVVLAAKWPSLAPEGAAAGAPTPPDFAVRNADSAGDSAADYDFAAALTRTVRLLREAGIEVFILTGVPNVPWPVGEVHARKIAWGGGALPEFSRADYDALWYDAGAIIDRVASREGARVVGDAAFFCDTKRCELLRDGRALIEDTNHLSAFGSVLYVTEVIAPQLDAATAAADTGGG
ncbi:MAG: acyltransferase family protein [Pseudomonadota bacterium]